MNTLERLVEYIKIIAVHNGDGRYNVREHPISGEAVLSDAVTKVIITVGVNHVHVQKYTPDGLSIKHEVTLNWADFTVRQREAIIEILDTPEELSLDAEEKLTEILKGI